MSDYDTRCHDERLTAVMLMKISIGLSCPTGTTAPNVILNSIQNQLSLSKKYSRP